MFLLAALPVVIGSHPLTAGWDGYPHGLRLADAVLGSVVVIGVFLRRRFPLGYALAVLPVACFTTLGGFAPLVAAFTVAVHRRWQVAVPVGVALAATSVPALLLYPPPRGQGLLASVTGAVAITLAFTGWGLFTRARRELLASLRERAERAEADQVRRADRARRAERQRIAREMHDVLAHRLSLLAVHAGALEFRADAPAGDVARAAAVVRATAHDALQELRDVVAVLRDDAPDNRDPAAAGPERPQPTLADLAGLLAEARSAGTRVRSSVGLDGPGPGRAAGRAAYRIIQESLTNARKHVPESPVDIDVSGAPDTGLAVDVRTRLAVDRAADPVPGAGAGLIGLAERATLLGGRLSAGPAGGDFVVRAWLPWTVEAGG